MLTPLPPEKARRFLDYLRESDYSHAGLQRILRATGIPSRTDRNLPRMLDLSSELAPLPMLVRLFAVGAEAPVETARQCLPDWILSCSTEHGLLERNDGCLKAAVMLHPFEGMVLAADLFSNGADFAAPDVVPGLNTTTWMVYRFTSRRPSRATLDIGTGLGAHALAAASFSASVVATDINPRATDFAKFNARLNGIDNIECLTGDTFEPVAGRRFDLIIGNPPFFITPQSGLLFCENPLDLDGFCRRMVRQAPGYLEEGGLMQILCEWAEVAGESQEERLAEWLDGSGCDALVLRRMTSEPSKYAQAKIRETTPPLPDRDAALHAQWMDYYSKRRVKAIHMGLIAIRRRSGRNWLRIEDLPGDLGEPFGDLVTRMFEARDLVEIRQNAGLLDIPFRFAKGAQMVQQFEPAGGQWRPVPVKLVLSTGIPLTQGLAPMVAEFVTLLDGGRSLGDRINEFAERAGVSVEQVQPEALAIVSKLLDRGFLCW